MATLKEIEATTKLYADARALLAGRVRELNDQVEAAKRERLPGIKRALNAAALLEMELREQIKESADQFVKPRSVVLHGVKVGYQKAPGAISWTNLDRVVALIREHFPRKFDVLVKATYKPVKKALAQLSAEDLKRIAVTVSADSDEVLIKDTASDVDKLVDALLKEAVEEEVEA